MSNLPKRDFNPFIQLERSWGFSDLWKTSWQYADISRYASHSHVPQILTRPQASSGWNMKAGNTATWPDSGGPTRFSRKIKEKDSAPNLKREKNSTFMMISPPQAYLFLSAYPFTDVISFEGGDSQGSPDSFQSTEYLTPCLPPNNWIAFPGATLFNHPVVRWLLLRKHRVVGAKRCCGLWTWSRWESQPTPHIPLMGHSNRTEVNGRSACTQTPDSEREQKSNPPFCASSPRLTTNRQESGIYQPMKMKYKVTTLNNHIISSLHFMKG